MPENCTHDCSTCGESCSERDLRVPANALSSIKKVIAVVSGKGGVGKSTVTSSLAVAMARRGRKVAVLDADITGPSIPTAFGLDTRAVGDGESIFPELTPGGIKIISLNLLLENKGDPVVWRGRLLGGVIWGVWHWPIMLLTGYEYGTHYLGAPVLGLVVWCVVCFALNTLLDWLYEKTGCIWVPAAAHGAFNAIASIAQVLTYPADAYYNVLGPMPIGLIGMLPMLALAVWLTLRQMKEDK